MSLRGAACVVMLAATVLVLGACGGDGGGSDDGGAGETQPSAGGPGLAYERPADLDAPFTAPSDVASSRRVGGSRRVCDRERLISELGKDPRLLREWTPPLAVEPTREAVAAYIAALRPVTLTRDTRVTNHALRDGKRVIYQAVLAAGTPVLVNKNANPVVRCHSGSPLAAPEPIEGKACHGCPAGYRLPRQCAYYGDDEPPPGLRRPGCYELHPGPPAARSR